MPTQCFIFALIFISVVSYNTVSGFQCYECSSLHDGDKCGTTWGFSGTEGDKYLKECDETAVGCKKLQQENTRLDTIMVTRSCHNGTTNANGTSYAPRGCTELYKGESCYCLPGADGKPCNGQEQTIVSLLLQGFSLMLIISLGYFI